MPIKLSTVNYKANYKEQNLINFDAQLQEQNCYTLNLCLMLSSLQINEKSFDSQALKMEAEKLSMLDQYDFVNRAFLMGYVAAYFPAYKKQANRSDWVSLMEAIGSVCDAVNDKTILPKSMFEIIIYSLSLAKALPGDISKCESTEIDLLRASKIITGVKNRLIEDKNYLNLAFGNMPIVTSPTIVKAPSTEEKQTTTPELQSSDIGLECSICCEPITLETVCPVACGHILHKNCLIEHFKSKVEIKKLPILCPEDQCCQQLTIGDIQEYITGEILEKYYEFSLHQFVDKNQKNTNWCPTAGCSAVFSFEEGLESYSCPSCKIEYCMKCRNQAHEGLTCEQHRVLLNLPEQEQEFMSLAKKANYKQCPSCKFWVSKNHGCDHMTCRCGHQFCFRCGAEAGTCSCDEAASFYDDNESNPDVGEQERE